MKYQTISAYVSGSIVGSLWMPSVEGGILFNGNLRQQFNRYVDKSGATFRDALLSMLNENGGDFQNPQFSADTVIRVERRHVERPGVYTMHIHERELSELRDCADLVNSDALTGDLIDA